MCGMSGLPLTAAAVKRLALATGAGWVPRDVDLADQVLAHVVDNVAVRFGKLGARINTLEKHLGITPEQL